MFSSTKRLDENLISKTPCFTQYLFFFLFVFFMVGWGGGDDGLTRGEAVEEEGAGVVGKEGGGSWRAGESWRKETM